GKNGAQRTHATPRPLSAAFSALAAERGRPKKNLIVLNFKDVLIITSFMVSHHQCIVLNGIKVQNANTIGFSNFVA
ncbi:MAG: hypothetical protein WCL14_13785, partial [Bacteroidota bacterium]